MRTKILFGLLLGVAILTGPACLAETIFEDPAYIAQKKKTVAAKIEFEAALVEGRVAKAELDAAEALLAAAKTDKDKNMASIIVSKAKLKLDAIEATLSSSEVEFKDAVAELEKIVDGAINSPASGVLGFLSSLPGIGGMLGGAALAIYTGIVRVSRGNMKGAVTELATQFQELRKRPEAAAIEKELRSKIKDRLLGTGAGKALDSVLTEMKVFKEGTGS